MSSPGAMDPTAGDPGPPTKDHTKGSSESARKSDGSRTGSRPSDPVLFASLGEPLRGDRLVKGGKRIGLQHGLLKRTGKEIPKVPQSSSDNQRRDSSFPVYSHALRPFNSTEDLHQDNARGSRLDNQYQQIQTHSAILPGVLGVPSRLHISKVSPASGKNTTDQTQSPSGDKQSTYIPKTSYVLTRISYFLYTCGKMGSTSYPYTATADFTRR
ncbi:uncharacterized protein [Ranitomeya imitator]|uniref:uncharacterized protein n=1 Tax=Ranitomeya imitator TaxID=111125 RepID=UPI0037E7C96D